MINKSTLSFYNFLSQKVRPMELALLLKKILGIKRISINTPDGDFQIDPVSNFGIRLLNEGTYEESIKLQIKGLLKTGDTFVDLGANEGYFSVIASKLVSEKGNVFAIEPQKRLWSVIETNALLNNSKNIKLIPNGVSDKYEKLNLVLTPSINTGSSSFVFSNRSLFWQRQTVECYTLDALFEMYQIPHTKLIKIDVEGFELNVLKGAMNVLKHKLIDYIILESHISQLSHISQSLDDIDTLLLSYGYKKQNDIYTHLIQN